MAYLIEGNAKRLKGISPDPMFNLLGTNANNLIVAPKLFSCFIDCKRSSYNNGDLTGTVQFKLARRYHVIYQMISHSIAPVDTC
ncbi:hypothetical protein BHE75_04061 [Sphingomonas haloaromaticamans]|uniref:Uncharacterized protein n=1 Tax=Edaphosphingomonas haloaromaticamans TaxID=653954 RepID=A0A1S1HIH7_9SPHN|nr:hypothetical protein BHE75_04061 [Sphingomonas haloaromaticamans]